MTQSSAACLLCGGDMSHVAQRRVLMVDRCGACGIHVGHMPQQVTEFANAAVSTDPNHFRMVIDRYEALADANSQLLAVRTIHYHKHFGQKPQNWLEIGPGSGAFGDAVTRSGAFWLGVEIDAEMAAHMRAKGRNVVHADFSERAATDLIPEHVKAAGGFDVVYFTQVFEHVVKPAIFLRNAFAALRPGGVLHLDVPNHNGLTSFIRKINTQSTGYGEIVPPHHMIAYGKDTMNLALKSAGFIVDTIFPCANNDAVFGLAHAIISENRTLQAVWQASRLFGLGGNLVALARKPNR